MGRKPIDLTGEKFGRLTAIKRIGLNKRNEIIWLFKCDCGNNKVALANDVKRGNTRSCGCLQYERIVECHTTHGYSRTRLYRIYSGMKHRCYDIKNKDYKFYGGRGISICNEWLDFIPFHDWAMSHGYCDNLSIDRIDNDKGYSPSNCRWATVLEQAHNRRRSGRTGALFTINNETKSIAEWARYFGIQYNIVWKRLRNGRDVEKAFTTPKLSK